MLAVEARRRSSDLSEDKGRIAAQADSESSTRCNRSGWI